MGAVSRLKKRHRLPNNLISPDAQILAGVAGANEYTACRHSSYSVLM